MGSSTNSNKSELSAVSAIIREDLFNAQDIKAFLNDHNKQMHRELSDYLSSQLAQKGLSVADVVRDSGLRKAHVYQVFSGDKMPSRDKLIAIAFGLHLDVVETQRILKIGGYSELYPRIPRDAVILFAILHGMDIGETDDLLDETGFPTILSAD